MRRFVLAVGMLVATALASTGVASGNGFANLQPGVPSAGLKERVPVNVVFVGFGPGQVKTGEFLSGLPKRYKPIVRSRLFYGNVEELGIDYTYDYSVTFASSAWEATFFSALKGL